MNSQNSPTPRRKLIVTPDEAAVEGVKLDLNIITNKEVSKAGVLWVVMDENCTTVVHMPGQTKPFHTKSRKYAESVARELGGIAKPYREALALVASSPCNFPKDSRHYNADPRASKVNLTSGRG